MKKLTLYFLSLAMVMTTPIRAYFIRGSIYKKDNQFIIFLGDWHEVNFLGQRYELIEYLKEFDKKQVSIIIEDPDNDMVLKHNKEYLLSKKIVGSIVDVENGCPISHLCSNLEKENLNTIDIETRKIIIAFIRELQATNLQLKSGLKIEHIINEVENNIRFVSLFNKKIRCSDIEYKDVILKYYKEKISKIINSSITFIRNLKYSINDLILDFIKDSPYHWVLDLNIIQNILQNDNKKIIVVCAGLLHTIEAENFIEKIGYKLIKEAGLNKKTDIRKFAMEIMSPNIYKIIKSSGYKMSEVSPNILEDMPKPVSILELFENIKKHIPCQQVKKISPYKYGRFTIPANPIFEQRYNLFSRAKIERPLNQTSKIVKKQIRYNYSLMFCKS